MSTRTELEAALAAELAGFKGEAAARAEAKLRREAMTLLRKGKALEAGARFSVLARRHPEDVDTMLRAAHAFEKAKDRQAAADWFRQAALYYAGHDHPAAALATLKRYRQLMPQDDRTPAAVFRRCRKEAEDPDAFLELLGERERLGYRLRDHDWFAALTDDAFDALLDRMKLIELAPGDVLMKMGEPATSMYLVVEGELEGALVLKGRRSLLGRIGPGDVCGEIGWFTGGRRTAEVVALKPSRLLEIPYDLLAELVSADEALRRRLEELYRARMLTKQLALAPVFGRLSPELRGQIARAMRAERLAAGHRIFAEGDEGTDVFMVRRGKVAVNLRVGGEDRLLKTVETGGLIGEMAAIAGGKRTASAIAVTDVELMRLPGEIYTRLIAGHPELRKLLEARKREQMDETRAFIHKSRQVEGDDTCELLLREIWKG